MDKKTPQLRICVIPYCNLHCVYCTPEGEGYAENLDERMTREEINRVVRICAEVGFTHVKFTGGEPLMRPDTVDIIADTKRVEGLQEVQMVTNGTLLARHAAQLKNAGLDVITISIDAADPDIYQRVRGGKLEPVLTGLRQCREVGLPVRINTVLLKRNLSQVAPLIDLSHRMETSLKFLDLLDLQREEGSYDFWREEFVHFGELRKILEDMGGQFVGHEEAPGGIGAPLLEYRMPNGAQVVLKDSTEGTYYADYCSNCRFYPCQDALISLRITHDGHLKMCLIRNDNLLDILTPLRAGDIATVKDRVKNRFDILTSAEYFPRKWQPRSLDSNAKEQESDAVSDRDLRIIP
jgi:cyclic pyranopterin phosphate synthase